MHDALSWLSAQYCARQNATVFLELWGFALALCGAATGTAFAARRLGPNRQLSAPLCAAALFFFALLTAVFAASIFYGCSATAASEQGLSSNLAPGLFTTLRCLGTDAFDMVQGWVLFVGLSIAAIVVSVLAVFRTRNVVRVTAFSGVAVLIVLAFACGLLLLFAFSLCESQRLM